MPLITEKVDVQNKILDYLISIGWEYVPPEEIWPLRENNPKQPFLLPILAEKLLSLNPTLINKEKIDEIAKRFKILPSTILGNEEFLKYLRGEKTVYYEKEKRERNFRLIDFSNLENNRFSVTKEFFFEDIERRRLDLVLVINGIPLGIIETKPPTEEEGEYKALKQIGIYNDVLPELFKFLQFYTVSEGLYLYYGATWDYNLKSFYKWKIENSYNFEKFIKSFFQKNSIINILEDFIVFFRQEDEINKYILRPHQIRAVAKIINRVKEEKDKRTGLVWHTQGSGKTLTMIVSSYKLWKEPLLNKPTIMAVVDRLELETQIRDNFLSFGFPNVVVAESKEHLRDLLSQDYRGLIVTTIHKFEGMTKEINKRENMVVLIDEAHRSQEGDLGNYMKSALPNAIYFGFTGTPIDKGIIGKGTFEKFGKCDYPTGYLDKYSIDESIDDKTTVPLYYTLTMSEVLVDKKTLEEEFYKVVEEIGAVSIEEVNKILEKAEKLKAVLKSPQRIDKIAQNIANHYKNVIEPLGFKGFIVAVDREACALYKKAIDKYLPADYSQPVYTRDYLDGALLKEYHLDEDEEKRIRKNFKNKDKLPKILIVTEKLLTGFDAPILYVMYLDKPLKDHTLLQAIARVNRPLEGKSCGLIVDYIGIFEDLQRALTFDSKDIKRALVNLDVLRERFKEVIGELNNTLQEIHIEETYNRIQNTLDYFSDEGKGEERRNSFISRFKEVERIYEILSPDAFLGDYIRDYRLLVQIYSVVYNYFNPEAERKRDLRALLGKTEKIISKNVEIKEIIDNLPVYEINKDMLNLIKSDNITERAKVVKLQKSLRVYIEKYKETQPFLLSLVEKVEEVILKLRERQISTRVALETLLKISNEILQAEDEQRKLNLSRDEFCVYWVLKSYEIANPDIKSKEVYRLLDEHKHWVYSKGIEKSLRIALYKLLAVSEVDLINNILKMHKNLVENVIAS